MEKSVKTETGNSFSAQYSELEIRDREFNLSDVPNRKWQDITDRIIDAISKSGIREGMAIVQVLHTTAGLVLNEAEEGLAKSDFPRLLQHLCPDENDYRHNRLERIEALGPEEPKNGASHLQCMIGALPSLTLIIHLEKLALGVWQRIIFFDFDPDSHPHRRIAIQILGFA